MLRGTRGGGIATNPLENPVRLSVVLPCYRSGALALASIARLRRDLEDFGDALEIIVVDDGGHDLTAESVAAAGGILISFPKNRGKGAAVRAGMLAATGTVRAFTDTDVPFGTDCLRAIEYYVGTRGFHVVIGDRTLPGSRYSAALTPVRRIASAIFTSLVGRLVTGGFFDTQCGVKGFRDDVARELFTRSRIDRFAFDVELVYLALKGRLDIKRMSVVLESNDTSSVRVVQDSWQMLIDLGRIIVGQKTGRYHTDGLEALVGEEETSERRAWLPERDRSPA